MGEDEATEGCVTLVAILEARHPCRAVRGELVDVRHDGVGLRCSLLELEFACDLCGSGFSGWVVVNGSVLAPRCVAVVVSGAVTTGDFATDVVDGV